MEFALSNPDTDAIWCEPLQVQAVRDARRWSSTLESGAYQQVEFTDGSVTFPALLLPGSCDDATPPLRAGQRVHLTKHRVQWTNNERHWFVYALAVVTEGDEEEAAPVPKDLRALPSVGPGFTVQPLRMATPAPADTPTSRASKRAKVTAAAHPFIL